MSELRKFLAPEFIFGSGAVKLTGQYAQNFGAKNPLIVTDKGIIDCGLFDNFYEDIGTYFRDPAVYSKVSPNPRDFEVSEGAEFYKACSCDVIIALGGGSVIDAAKGIGIVVSNGRNILEFEGADNVESPGPPLICIPTTAGTSADVSQFAIINDTERRVKIAIISKSVVPDIALIDPETTESMPAYLTACTGIDALVHAIEAFVSNANSPLTDMHALQAIDLIAKNLKQSIDNPRDKRAKDNMMLASLTAGLAFSNASLGVVHGMAHSLGGYLDLPHGECNALLLDRVVDFNFDSAPERYRKIAETLGLEISGLPDQIAKNKLIEEIVRVRKSSGITASLSERGVACSDISELAGKAVKDPCMVTNPRKANKRDIEVIYEEAL